MILSVDNKRKFLWEEQRQQRKYIQKLSLYTWIFIIIYSLFVTKIFIDIKYIYSVTKILLPSYKGTSFLNTGF